MGFRNLELTGVCDHRKSESGASDRIPSQLEEAEIILSFRGELAANGNLNRSLPRFRTSRVNLTGFNEGQVVVQLLLKCQKMPPIIPFPLVGNRQDTAAVGLADPAEVHNFWLVNAHNDFRGRLMASAGPPEARIDPGGVSPNSPDGHKCHKVVYDGVHLHFPQPMRPDRAIRGQLQDMAKVVLA